MNLSQTDIQLIYTGLIFTFIILSIYLTVKIKSTKALLAHSLFIGLIFSIIIALSSCASQKKSINKRLVKCHSKDAKIKKAYFNSIQYN